MLSASCLKKIDISLFKNGFVYYITINRAVNLTYYTATIDVGVALTSYFAHK